METNHPRRLAGRRKIAEVIRYLDFQRSITGDRNGDRYAGFYLANVPGAEDELDFHIPKSVLRRLENEGYIKFTDTSRIKELNNFCAVEFLPKYKYIRFKYIYAINFWEVTNPVWILWQSARAVIAIATWLWNKSKTVTVILSIVGGLLAVDWALAWKNLSILLSFLKVLSTNL